ncbi:MAG: HAD family phosphatase [Pseudomonadota bacterium]
MSTETQTLNRVLTDFISHADLVLFDFDGVVVRSEIIALRVLSETLAAHNITLSVSEVRERFLGVSSKTVLNAMTEEHAHFDEASFVPDWEARLNGELEQNLAAVSGITDVLHQLAESNLPYCIASSSTFSRLHMSLRVTGLTERFSNIFSAELVENGKPAPDLFLLAASEMGVSPDKCLVIEDSPKGVQGAKAAGMRALGFVGGGHLEGIEAQHTSALLDAGADAVINSY